jgi:NitT/TauT family transport system permease protein
MLSQVWRRVGSAWVGLALFVLLWDLALYFSSVPLLPRPWQVGLGLLELLRRGVLFKHLIASLFRVTWGFLLAVGVALPLGFVLGWSLHAGRALGPFVQLVRPISPLAWIPLAILWFGVGDVSAVFILFIASAPPLTLAAMSAVRNVPAVYVQAGQNFGLNTRQLFLRILLPAALPELLSGMRLTLGISWLVVVAAEMIAVNSGLGYLIVDSRNAGNRYDLVVAGMVLIGITGLALDRAMARVARSLMHRQDVVGEEMG